MMWIKEGEKHNKTRFPTSSEWFKLSDPVENKSYIQVLIKKLILDATLWWC